MSMPATEFFSADMVRALPDDGKRYETVHGELFVTPAPRVVHQLVCDELQFILQSYLKREGLAGFMSSPADISWGPDLLVQPDLFVMDQAEARAATIWQDIQTLLLVVEVGSPSSMRADRFTKRRLYQEHQVATYWIVDLDQRQAEVWTPEAVFPVVERERLRWHHPQGRTECAIDLNELFALATGGPG